MNELEIKDIPFREITGSQGFFVPVQFTDARMKDGLKIGDRYDLIIRKVQE